MFSKKAISLITIAFAFLFAAISIIFYYSNVWGTHLFLIKAQFRDLPGWDKDDQSDALLAFQKSCIEILRPGHNKDWQDICRAAQSAPKHDPRAAKHFFEDWFQPYHVTKNLNANGLFTGYYLPTLSVTSMKDKNHRVPIYGLPIDLIKINLGQFYPNENNKIVVGRIENNILYPYYDRKEISNGALAKKAEVLAWGDSIINLFFAQIQGSVKAVFPNHRTVILGYAGDNGRPYFAIGKWMLDKNIIPKKTISMQSILAWLNAHPNEASDILNQNPSYVFFKILKNKEPVGTETVELTPMRSIAVDTHYIPLGAPVWLDTVIPTQSKNQTKPFQQLMISQDTGGAIKGIVRADIYCGSGHTAAFVAGHMKNVGQYWILLPLRK